MRRIFCVLALSLGIAACSDGTPVALDAQSGGSDPVPSAIATDPAATSEPGAEDEASTSGDTTTDQPPPTEPQTRTPYPPDSALLSADPTDLWIIDEPGFMESLANGHLVNLGGCLGLQAEAINEPLGLPLVLAGFAPDLLLADGTGIRSGSTEVRFGERVVVGGGQFDAPILADPDTKAWLGEIPAECPLNDFVFVADSIKPE